jgi:hypothetical protein
MHSDFMFPELSVKTDVQNSTSNICVRRIYSIRSITKSKITEQVIRFGFTVEPSSDLI